MKRTFATPFFGIIHKRWYYAAIFLFLFLQAFLLYGLGEGIYVSAHDNLDLHIADYHLLSETGTFFSQNSMIPVLGGISRDYFASELSLYSLLYFLLPTQYAYITGYILKTVIAVLSCVVLAKEVFKDQYSNYEGLVVLCSFAFGILPLYPAFSFPFVSLGLVIALLIRIQRKPFWRDYVLLFFYPLLSYFTFVGFFILAYLLLYCILNWIRKRRFPASLFLALVVLTAGYMVMEYRLFRIMLFQPVPTIRETITEAGYHLSQIPGLIGDVFIRGIFHADSVHTLFILPLTILAVFLLCFNSLRNKHIKHIFREPLLPVLGLILFNCCIYGLYHWAPLRQLVETILPPLKGFQFNRTVFFNPFLWYLLLFLIAKKLFDTKRNKTAYGVIFIAIMVILLTGSKYNDLYHTGYNYAYQILRQTPSNNLTYGEFYSTGLFEEIKKEISYQGEMSVAYGMHPAVIEYNGIATLDGCLSYYPQAYKEEFRAVIAPALNRVESFRTYYDDWGARAYLFAGVDENVYEPVRNLSISDQNLYIDSGALRSMGGKYIFSRLEISNATELGLELRGIYTGENSPYTIYLYDTGTEQSEIVPERKVRD